MLRIHHFKFGLLFTNKPTTFASRNKDKKVLHEANRCPRKIKTLRL